VNVLTAITVGLAAASSLLSAISALAAWRSASAVRDELKHTVTAKRHELLRTFEQDYAAQYDAIWQDLGPWPDPDAIDPQLRRTVQNLLQATASVFIARQSDLVDSANANALLAVHFDWLGTDKAYQVWKTAFRNQSDTWPSGFVNFVDGGLEERRKHRQTLLQHRPTRPKLSIDADADETEKR
jgi:hypothetical protein